MEVDQDTPKQVESALKQAAFSSEMERFLSTVQPWPQPKSKLFYTPTAPLW